MFPTSKSLQDDLASKATRFSQIGRIGHGHLSDPGISPIGNRAELMTEPDHDVGGKDFLAKNIQIRLEDAFDNDVISACNLMLEFEKKVRDAACRNAPPPEPTKSIIDVDAVLAKHGVDIARYLHVQARITNALQRLATAQTPEVTNRLAVAVPVHSPIAGSDPEHNEAFGRTSHSSQPSAVQAPRLTMVITAHPTRTANPAIAASETRFLECADRLMKRPDQQDLSTLRNELSDALSALIGANPLREKKPTVLEEHHEMVIQTLPQTVRAAKKAVSGDTRIALRTWCAGDHDGHPDVDAASLEQAAKDRTVTIIGFYLSKLSKIGQRSSAADAPEIMAEAQRIAKKLENTKKWIEHNSGNDSAERYADSQSFQHDILVLADLAPTNQTLQRLRTSANNFGLHYAAVDLRQNSAVFKEMAAEFYQRHRTLQPPAETSNNDAEPLKTYDQLTPQEKTGWLKKTIQSPDFPSRYLDEKSHDNKKTTSREIGLIQSALDLTGKIAPEAVGYQIIANTSDATNMLEALLAVRASGRMNADMKTLPLPIVPLFETGEDLQNAHEIMRDYLQALKDMGLQLPPGGQPVMVGYSDSNKDAGFLSSRWGVFKAVEKLAASVSAADDTGAVLSHGLTIFHGNGGSEARGGGDLELAIKARHPVGPTSEWTVQGEALHQLIPSARLGAHHLSGLAQANALREAPRRQEMTLEQCELMDRLTNETASVYRGMQRSEPFVTMFKALETVFPVSQLNAGSRPAERPAKVDNSGAQALPDPAEALKGVRAISHNIPTTALRSMFQIVYGFGTAVSALEKTEPDIVEKMKALHRDSPVFQSMMADLETGMAKANPHLVKGVLDALANRNPTLKASLETFQSQWLDDFEKGKAALLAITEQKILLENRPALQHQLGERLPIADAAARLASRVLGLPSIGDKSKSNLLAVALSTQMAALQAAA